MSRCEKAYKYVFRLKKRDGSTDNVLHTTFKLHQLFKLNKNIEVKRVRKGKLTPREKMSTIISYKYNLNHFFSCLREKTTIGKLLYNNLLSRKKLYIKRLMDDPVRSDIVKSRVMNLLKENNLDSVNHLFKNHLIQSYEQDRRWTSSKMRHISKIVNFVDSIKKAEKRVRLKEWNHFDANYKSGDLIVDVECSERIKQKTLQMAALSRNRADYFQNRKKRIMK